MLTENNIKNTVATVNNQNMTPYYREQQLFDIHDVFFVKYQTQISISIRLSNSPLELS